MSEILGKVTSALEGPRGADVSLRIAVPRLWLFEGRSIEVELPRNLVCANCSGGGCGRCQQSGAITVRARGELPEVVQVCLPEQGKASTRASIQQVALRNGIKSKPGSGAKVTPKSVRPLTIRIPECGGLPEAGSKEDVRGWLLLHVGIATEPSAHVRLLDDEDPLSSSKMVRAEAKRVLTGELANGSEASTADDADSVSGDGSSPSNTPPSTRVVKVRSMRASDPKSLQRASREQLDDHAVSPEPGKPEIVRRPGWAIGVSLVVVVAVVLAWLWYSFGFPR